MCREEEQESLYVRFTGLALAQVKVSAHECGLSVNDFVRYAVALYREVGPSYEKGRPIIYTDVHGCKYKLQKKGRKYS